MQAEVDDANFEVLLTQSRARNGSLYLEDATGNELPAKSLRAGVLHDAAKHDPAVTKALVGDPTFGCVASITRRGPIVNEGHNLRRRPQG